MKPFPPKSFRMVFLILQLWTSFNPETTFKTHLTKFFIGTYNAVGRTTKIY
jgi:hypothetical protein